jgi:hypothetical protein
MTVDESMFRSAVELGLLEELPRPGQLVIARRWKGAQRLGIVDEAVYDGFDQMAKFIRAVESTPGTRSARPRVVHRWTAVIDN